MATDTAADAVHVAASSSSIETNQILSATNIVYPYFFMTVTNYPNLLQHVNQYQPINMQWQRQHQGGMLIPAIAVHFGIAYTDEHERLLYNTLKFEIQEAIRTYLQRTRRASPIHLIFDLSGIES